MFSLLYQMRYVTIAQRFICVMLFSVTDSSASNERLQISLHVYQFCKYILVSYIFQITFLSHIEKDIDMYSTYLSRQISDITYITLSLGLPPTRIKLLSVHVSPTALSGQVNRSKLYMRVDMRLILLQAYNSIEEVNISFVISRI